MLDNKNHQWPLIVSAERSRVTYFLPIGQKISDPAATNSTRFWHAWLARCFGFHSLGKTCETKKTVLRPPNKYSISNAPLSCQPISVNPHNFSRLPKLQAVILYNIPTCQAADPVLLYSQKRKTGNKPEGSVTVLRNQRSLGSIEKSFHIQVVLPYEKCMIDMCAE